MLNIQEIMNMSVEERHRRQKGKTRGLAIGIWAPREPMLMGMLRNAIKNKGDFSKEVISKIIDRIISIGIFTTVATLEEIIPFIESIPDDFEIVKGPCACRINTAEEAGFDARDIQSGHIDYCKSSPLNLDIQFGKCGEKFGKCEGYEPITKEELIELERECHNMGLVSNLYVMFGGEGSICHCSSKTCVPLITYRYVCDGKRKVYKKGAFIAETDHLCCEGSGKCASVCHFNARTMVEEKGMKKMVFDPVKCYGCGICASVCPTKAVSMVERTLYGKSCTKAVKGLSL